MTSVDLFGARNFSSFPAATMISCQSATLICDDFSCQMHNYTERDTSSPLQVFSVSRLGHKFSVRTFVFVV